MYYIDDISYQPWSIIDFRRYQSYLELRKERDKFLKSLKPGWYVDWLIQKKAIEAGGVGDTIYILPVRGGSKFPYDRIEKYIEEGRDVQFVHMARGNGKWRTVDRYLEEKELLLEKLDLYGRFGGYINDQLLQQLRADLTVDKAREKLWSTSVRPDSYIFDNKTYADWAMRDFLLNPNYGIVYKKED